jgi:DNA-3-methyladenine glycosylase II
VSFELELQKGVRTLSRRDPLLRPVAKAHGLPTFRPGDDYFGSLVDAIISQQISGKAAESILARLNALTGGRATPAVLAALPDEAIRSAGVSPQKLGYLRSLVEHVEQNLLKLPVIADLPDEEVIRELTAIKGIGVWTAQMFLLFTLGRLDVLPTGDLGVKKGVQILLDLPEMPTPARVEGIAEERGWAPYRSIASWYMWRVLS